MRLSPIAFGEAVPGVARMPTHPSTPRREPAAARRRFLARGIALWIGVAIGLFLASTAPSRAQAPAPPQSRIEVGPWSGGVTPTSGVVKLRLKQADEAVYLLVENHSRPEPLRRIGPLTSKAVRNNVLEFEVGGLVPATRYRCVPEIRGRPEFAKSASFTTTPVGAASFRFAFASCGRTASTNASYDRIREYKPLFFLCPGDLHYEDITADRVERFFRAYDKVFGSPVQARLYRLVPLVYIWDDHDYCGNGSDERAAGRRAARAGYEIYAPHHPLVFSGLDAPVSQAFTVGRTRFLLTDLRSHRDRVSAKDGPGKSLLGREQKEWLKRELLAARDSHAVTFWVSSVPWIGSTSTNNYWPVTTNDFGYLHHRTLAYTTNNGAKPAKPTTGDSWAWYAHERREIADFIKSNHIHNLILLHGDMHALAADDGSHSDYATDGGAPIPVFAAAPLDREASIKGGPYSAGVYKPHPGEGCFGLVDVQDRGKEVLVRFSGQSNDGLERIGLTVRIPVPASR